MNTKNGRIKIFKENRRENTELATFDILEEWRNKHVNPESRQELYQILMQASEKGLIDGNIFQFLKEEPK